MIFSKDTTPQHHNTESTKGNSFFWNFVRYLKNYSYYEKQFVFYETISENTNENSETQHDTKDTTQRKHESTKDTTRQKDTENTTKNTTPQHHNTTKKSNTFLIVFRLIFFRISYILFNFRYFIYKENWKLFIFFRKFL